MELAVESELAQESHALAGDRIPANFVARKSVFIDQQCFQTLAHAIERSRCASRSATDDDGVVMFIVSLQNALLDCLREKVR